MLRPSRICTSLLTYDKPENLFVVEDSTLNLRPARVWIDSCDVGYTLVSHRTGAEIVYALNLIVENSDREIMYWDYRPAEDKNPALPTLRIFND
jgi:hypothetical protein